MAGDLGVPDAVKFDSDGYIVSTQVASGQVLRIDPRSGEKTVLAQLNPGLDNLTFVGDRLFVSNFTGEITEILGGGETQTVLPGGLNWPLDLAVGDDGTSTSPTAPTSTSCAADGTLQTVGMLFTPGYPGFLRGVAARRRRRVRRHDLRRPGRPLPARRRRNRLSGRRISTSSTASRSVRGGAIVFAELGTGRVLRLRSGAVEVLATGLNEPVGVAIARTGGRWSPSPAPGGWCG